MRACRSPPPAYLGHSVEVNHEAYVKARRDAIERDAARDALVAYGLGVNCD